MQEEKIFNNSTLNNPEHIVGPNEFKDDKNINSFKHIDEPSKHKNIINSFKHIDNPIEHPDNRRLNSKYDSTEVTDYDPNAYSPEDAERRSRTIENAVAKSALEAGNASDRLQAEQVRARLGDQSGFGQIEVDTEVDVTKSDESDNSDSDSTESDEQLGEEVTTEDRLNLSSLVNELNRSSSENSTSAEQDSVNNSEDAKNA